MKNILKETAKDELSGRTKYVFQFVQKEDRSEERRVGKECL